MSRKRTQKEYEEELKDIGICVVGKYMDNNTKIAHECPVCHRQD